MGCTFSLSCWVDTCICGLTLPPQLFKRCSQHWTMQNHLSEGLRVNVHSVTAARHCKKLPRCVELRGAVQAMIIAGDPGVISFSTWGGFLSLLFDETA